MGTNHQDNRLGEPPLLPASEELVSMASEVKIR